MDNIFKAQSKFGYFPILAKFPLNTGIELNFLTKNPKNIKIFNDTVLPVGVEIINLKSVSACL